MSVRAWLRQVIAIATAEGQRLLTNPVWAALLALWTIVCGLFVQVVAARAVEQPLPAGETPMSAFFRFFPGLLPLLLVVFVPQLTMDAIAGRRERGRLEQLQGSGLAPGALVMGSFLATAAMLLLLAVPIAIFHLVLGASDAGATLAAIVVLLAQAAVIAALGLCASAWAPGRLAAALVAAAVGLAWWVADVFAPAVRGSEAGSDVWQRLFGLAQAIHDAAVGSLGLAPLLTALVMVAGLLALARCALRWRGLGPRVAGVAAILMVCAAATTHLTRLRSSVDLAADPALAPATVALIDDLTSDAPLRASLIATNAMTNDPVDGPLIAHLRRILRTAAGHGLRWQLVDPERSPQRVVAIRDRFAIADRELTRPLLVIEHLDRGQVVSAGELSAVREERGRRHLVALDAERALARALHRISGALVGVAWMTTSETRSVSALAPDRRRAAVGAWRHLLADAGFAVADIDRWQALDVDRSRIVVVPGLGAPLDEPAVTALRDFVAAGGHAFIALDPGLPQEQPALRAWLAEYGIAWTGSTLRAPDGAAITTREPDARSGPAVALAHAGERAVLPQALALVADQSRRGVGSLGTWLSAPAGSQVVAPVGVGLLEHDHPCLLTSVPISADDQRGSLAVLASAQALSDGDIDRGGNRLLPAGIARWLMRDSKRDGEALSAATAGTLQPRRIERGRITLARWLSGLVVPAVACALGFGTWWWRRRA